MASTTILIRSDSYRHLKEIAESRGQSLQDALDDAIEERARMLYLEGVNADYAALDRKAPTEFKNSRAPVEIHPGNSLVECSSRHDGSNARAADRGRRGWSS
jgi:hypothetical protein